MSGEARLRNGAGVVSAARPGVPVNMLEDGLVWAINAAVLHPRGFALAYVSGPVVEGQEPELGQWRLIGDGTERWAFAEDDGETSAATDRRWEAFEALLQLAREINAEGVNLVQPTTDTDEAP